MRASSFARLAEETYAEGFVRLGWDQRGIASVVLDRPERRNSLNHDMAVAVLGAVLAAGEDPRVRVIVLRGAGGAFCAGDDVLTVDRWREGDRDGAPFDRLTADAYYLRICEALLTVPKPVVAVLEGVSAGAGTEIACAADLRFCSPEARIGSCLVSVGHVGNVVMMSRVVGPARATEIYMTGRLVGAQEALAVGLVDRVADREGFARELDVLLDALASAPTRAIGLFKELRERSWGESARSGLRLQDEFHLRTHREVADGAEGLRAFVEHRPPRFRGE